MTDTVGVLPRQRSIGNRTARVIRVVVIVLGPILAILWESIGQAATPVPYRPEIAYTTLHAAVPIVFAVCALIGSRIGLSPLPIWLMIAISYLWIPQTIFTVLGPYGAVWPLVRSIELVWALLIGLLALAYPRGRYVGVIDHVVLAVAITVSALRVVAVILIDQPDPLQCACAPNVYAITENADLYQTIDLAYRVAGAAMVLFIAARLLNRWIRGSVPARTVAFVMPIGLIAWTLALITEAVSFGLTRPETGALVVITAASGPINIISLFAVASVPICYVAGTVHLRNTRGRVADLMRITREGADREVWRDSLSSTLGDPGLEVYWWDDKSGGYVDTAGSPVEVPDSVGLPGSAAPRDDKAGRTLLPIRTDDGGPIAVIRHDQALTENERLLDGVSIALQLSVDNRQLRGEVERTLTNVRESRQRIVEAGDEARKRLERDLHDGSQQQLVAVAMELRTVCTAAQAAGQHELAEEIERVIERLSTALRELRELARGIHPTVLVEGGLGLALPELASRCLVPVVVESEMPFRPTELVEATVYFVASECLVNIARHSQARQAWLRIETDADGVTLTVRDNGVGGVDTGAGSGVLGLIDRVEAIGGTMAVRSPQGEGTTISVRLPLDTPSDAGLG